MDAVGYRTVPRLLLGEAGPRWHGVHVHRELVAGCTIDGFIFKPQGYLYKIEI